MIGWLKSRGVNRALNPSSFSSPEEDAALVQRVLESDPDALAVLADRLVCVPRILRTLDNQNRRVLGHTELEDLAQDTLLRLWQKLASFPSYATLEMWVYRFCQFEYLNRLRRLDRQSRVLRAVENPPEAQVLDPEPDPIDWGERLDTVLDALGPPEADVIRMKHFEERTFDELASALNMPVNTAKARYYRGLAKLREQLEREHGMEDLL